MYRSWKYHTVTCVKFSDPVKKQKVISQERERLLDEVEEVTLFCIDLNRSSLLF